VTAPTSTDAPADAGKGQGQAPADSSSEAPAGPGSRSEGSTGTAGSAADGAGPAGQRAADEHVRSSSRDDEAPQDQPARPVPLDAAGSAADHDARSKGSSSADWRMEDLPAGAQKVIKDLRGEAATRRTEAGEARKAREQAEQQAKAGDERFATAVEAFTRALGLTPDADEPQRSPEELLGEVQANYQHARIELAVFRAAGAGDADPGALLDSLDFLTRVRQLDPAAPDFQESIAKEITAALERNPKLRAQAAEPSPGTAAPSGGDFGGGPAERIGPDEWSVDDFRRARQSGRGLPT